MIIPKRKVANVFSDDPKADRKKEAEELLKHLAESNPNYDEPDHSADAYRNLHNMLCGAIMWISIIGTVALSAAGIYYLTIPKPLVYVTTQNGNLHLLHPISVQQ
jgi:hypothetical protein